MTYNGNIRPGMGVQKRYTGNSFFAGDIEELELGEKGYGGGRNEEKRTWALHDSLGRWRKGLHPFGGKRNDGFARIGYF